MKPGAVLFDLPTFPQGVLSLSLPMVAACLRPSFTVRIIDLNMHPRRKWDTLLRSLDKPRLIGLKVSAQSLESAIFITAIARKAQPRAKILWGGELPTLMPALCEKHADAIIKGRIEPVASTLARDLKKGNLKRHYEGGTWKTPGDSPVPALDLIERPSAYLQFMGSPLESSQGCGQSCTFCMVHAMQRRIETGDRSRIERDLAANPREFINVVDYNLGNDKGHLISLAGAIKDSSAVGWMGESCIEALDDDDVLRALSESRCRIVYCGLESVSTHSLRSVAKTQNIVENYKRIIRKVQARGIQVATGFILGLSGTTQDSFTDFLDFCDEAGVIYLKLTYLIYNPGTKVNASMRSLGSYVSEEIPDFDGNHLTYLPEDVSGDEVFAGAKEMVKRFYSRRSAWTRSKHLVSKPGQRAEFLLTSYCFGDVYRQWLAYNTIQPGGGRFKDLLARPMRKSVPLRFAERLLTGLRRRRARRAV